MGHGEGFPEFSIRGIEKIPKIMSFSKVETVFQEGKGAFFFDGRETLNFYVGNLRVYC